MAKIDPGEPCPCGSGMRFADCHAELVSSNEPEIRTEVPLTVIPEPAPNTRTMFQRGGEGTVFMQGTTSDIAYTCGNCGAHLLRGVEAGTIMHVVFRCAACDCFNDSGDLPPQ